MVAFEAEVHVTKRKSDAGVGAPVKTRVVPLAVAREAGEPVELARKTFPVEPLLEVVRREVRGVAKLQVTGSPSASSGDPGLGTLAQVRGLSQERLSYLATKQRPLTFWEADAWACSLGWHPSLVWGELWWEACAVQGDADFGEPVEGEELGAGKNGSESGRDGTEELVA